MQSAQWHKNETHQTGHPTRIYKTSWIYSSSGKNSTENIYSQSQKLKFKIPEQAPYQNGSCEKQEKPKTNKTTRRSRRNIEKELNSWSVGENWYFINHKYSSISDVITPKDSRNKKKTKHGTRQSTPTNPAIEKSECLSTDIKLDFSYTVRNGTEIQVALSDNIPETP